MPSTNRPQKYRKIVEVEAFRMDDSNGEAVARWCGGRYSPTTTAAEPNVQTPRVLVPYFDASGTLSVEEARPGSYVIKNKDGTHEVWSAERFKESGVEPFYHRGNARGGNQSDE